MPFAFKAALQPGLVSRHGGFDYHEFEVPRELTWLVERFYFLGTSERSDAAFHVVADGRSDLLFDCRGEQASRVTLSLGRPLRVDLPGSLRMLGVRLRPGGLFHLTQPWDLQRDGKTTRLDDLPLRDRRLCFRRRGDPDVLLAELTDRLFRPRPEAIVNRLPSMSNRFAPEDHPGVAIERVDRAGLSSRHYRRLFARQFGLSPMRFHRVQRFQASLRALSAHPQTSLTEIAHAHGYCDQAHMTNEWVLLSGQRPTWWRGRFFQDTPSAPR